MEAHGNWRRDVTDDVTSFPVVNRKSQAHVVRLQGLHLYAPHDVCGMGYRVHGGPATRRCIRGKIARRDRVRIFDEQFGNNEMSCWRKSEIRTCHKVAHIWKKWRLKTGALLVSFLAAYPYACDPVLVFYFSGALRRLSQTFLYVSHGSFPCLMAACLHMRLNCLQHR